MLQLMLCQSRVSSGLSITTSAEVSLPASKEAVTVVAFVSPAPQAEGSVNDPMTAVLGFVRITGQDGEQVLL